MTLYPRADTRDSRWGGQYPAKTVMDGNVHRLAEPGEAGTVPGFVALDSEANAVTRMITAWETDLPPYSIRNRGLNGGDDVATVNRLYDEIETERVKFRKLIPSAFNTVSEYKVALGMLGRLLDPTTWYNGLKAELGVTTWSEVVNATKPAAME